MDFETMVRRGLGRAIIYARENDISEHRDFLLYACLHNIALDPQLEMTNRAKYMSDLLDATGEREQYTEGITVGLEGPTQELSVYQAYEILSWLGFHGDEQARKALYDAVTQDPTQEHYSIATSLVKMDKLEGFLYVLEQMTGRKLPEHDRWHLSEMLDIVTSNADRETTLNLALQKRTHLAPLVNLMRAAKEEHENSRPYVRPPDPAPNYAGVTHLIHTLDKRTYPMRYAKWGAQLDEERITRLAEDTLREDDPERLRRYLYLFQQRIFPLDAGRLLRLALDAEYKIASAARRALNPIVSQDVRDLALKILSRDAGYFDAIDLLNRNYQEGDWAVITEVTERDLEPEEYHGITLDTIRFFDEHFSPDAKAALFHMYERAPCSLCRGTIVENLLNLGELADWMIEECKYDASEDTRELVWSLLPQQDGIAAV